MARRVHVPQIVAGRMVLEAAEAHHLRNVLRLGVGDAVEAFDDAGCIGRGRLVRVDAGTVELEVEAVEHGTQAGLRLTIASAVPKGPRADWMIEKLSELGVAGFVPLAAKRSVVVPEGINKLERWRRLALESAKQSRRSGVLEIEAVQTLDQALSRLAGAGAAGAVATTEMPGMPLGGLLADMGRTQLSGPAKAPPAANALWIFIGPEGGWDAGELEAMQRARLTAVTLGTTILRVETAAIAAAAVVAARGTPDEA